MSESTHGDQPATSQGKAKRGNSHEMPPPAPGQKDTPKRKGLTLEALRKAITDGNSIPLAAPVSSAVVIDVRKPEKSPFMAHPSPDFSTIAFTLAVKSPTGVGEAIYLLDPDIAALIPGYVRLMRFSLCFDAWQRRPFIWPITVQGEGQRQGNSWITSAMRIWGAAKERWVCCLPGGGAYELHEPVVPIKGEPAWPDKTFEELMQMGFADLYIGDADHPEIVKRLTNLIPE